MVALFKGHEFGAGHKPCLHRSPPIEDSGERRLVLVIDTPARQGWACSSDWRRRPAVAAAA